jgi:hypothetical protein
MRRVCLLTCIAFGVVPVTFQAVEPTAGVQAAASIARSVFVSAFDSNGAPVDDLVAADFVVKENGKVRDVVRAVPGGPVRMHVAIIVDDNGTGLFRAGVARFIQRLQGRAQFAVTTVVGQPQKLVDYTANTNELIDAISAIGARPGTPDGGQLLQGIYDAAKEQARLEAARPVIVALTIPGEEHTTLPARYVLDQLRDTGATLHVFATAGSASRQLSTVSKPAALLEENFNLGEVLGDGPKQSGGRRTEIVAAAGVVSGLQELAEELLHQYFIEYDLPGGVKPSDRLNIAVKRRGVTVRAPSRIRAK